MVDRFLACGMLEHGFARVRCDACAHEYLLAFSCKSRYLCPNCHAKRLCPYCLYRRPLLGELSRLAARIVTDGGFRPEGTLVRWPSCPTYDSLALSEAFRRAVLPLFVRRGFFNEDRAQGMLQ